jgi:hypothetical protein
MRLHNTTDMAAGYTCGVDPNGGQRVIVAVKGTFVLPPPGGVPKLSSEQTSLLDADQFDGEPGISAPKSECDWALQKSRCDILLN